MDAIAFAPATLTRPLSNPINFNNLLSKFINPSIWRYYKTEVNLKLILNFYLQNAWIKFKFIGFRFARSNYLIIKVLFDI